MRRFQWIKKVVEQRSSLLVKAASAGDEEEVKLLLADTEIHANYSTRFIGSPLSAAVFHGHQGVVKLLLADERVDVNFPPYIGLSYLSLLPPPPLSSLAAKYGHEAIVKLLLEDERVDVNASNFEGTAFTIAAAGGHRGVVELLLKDERVDVNVPDWDGLTPLSIAAKNGHQAVIELLLTDNRVSVGTEDRFKLTPLSQAAANGHNAIVKLLLENDWVNSRGANGQTPLIRAVKKRKAGDVELLLKNNRVDVNIRDNSGRTALSHAATPPGSFQFLCNSMIFEGEKIVELLLSDIRVDINAQDNFGRTPLSHAATTGWKAIVKLLLASDETVANTPDIKGRTPLSFAAKKGDKEIVEILLHHTTKERSSGTPVYLLLVLHIILLLEFIAKRLQGMLQVEILLNRLSEFPNRLRPPCTTMPWIVRPALVVLWGVCWMFYSPPATSQHDTSLAIWNEKLVDGGIDNPASVDPWTSLPLQVLTDSGNTDGANIFAYDSQMGAEQTILQPAVPAIDSNYRAQGGTATIETFSPFQSANVNNHDQSTGAVGLQNLTQSDLVEAHLSREGVEGHILPIGTIPQSTQVERAGETHQDPEGIFMCTRVECNGIRFNRRCDLKAHMDRQHNRPYKCEYPGCSHTRGFGAKGELKRHMNSKHKSRTLLCPVAGCSHSFARKDNLKDHISRQHRDSVPEPQASPVEHGSPRNDCLNVVASGMADEATPTTQADVSVRGARKRRREPEGILSPLNTESSNEDLRSLQEENKRLRKEIEDVKGELELFKKREEIYLRCL